MSTAPTERHLVLGPELAGTLMTPEEFDAIEDYNEDFCYELVHGVLVVTPVPRAEETDPNEALGHWLRNYQEGHRQGSALDMTLPQQYVNTPTSRRLADRLIWTGLGRVPDRRRDLPSIAVEFVSAGRGNWRRDYVDKRMEYMEAGIPEYWIFDRFQRTLTVIRRDSSALQQEVIAADGVYRPALLPGFELQLGPLLAVADRWPLADEADA